MRLTLIIAAFLFCTFTCREEVPPEEWEHGYIVGFDPRDCMCCGGWLIKIGDDPIDFQFFDLPSGSTLDLDPSDFPLRVKVKWAWSSTCADTRTIQLLEIEPY